jgi:outer membrane protein assembly factor BamB
MPRLLLLSLVLALAAPAAAQHWPSFRGPGAAGVAPGPVPVRWNVTSRENVAWRTPVPGLAHSSPIVWGERIFLTTAVPLADADTSLRLGNVDAAGIGAARDLVRHAWRVLALDRRTGRVLWTQTAYEGTPRVKRHVKASHASATPATDGRVVVAMLGSEGLYCYDVEGRLRWKQDLGALSVGLADDPGYEWGPASSPVIAGGRVIVQNDRYKDSYVAAYDLETGKEAWRSSREELPAWSTPTVARAGDRDVVVVSSPRQVRAHDLETGRVLWSMPDPQGEVKVPTPIVAGPLAIVTGGYPPGGRPIVAIRLDARGEVSAGGPSLAWRIERGSPYTGTPIVHDGLLYVCTDNGILSAYDVATGARVYQQRIAPGAAGFSASPIVAQGRLYLASEDGQVYVVRTGRTFELLATNDMGEVTMATPAVAGNLLLVRTRGHLYALQASETASASP